MAIASRLLNKKISATAENNEHSESADKNSTNSLSDTSATPASSASWIAPTVYNLGSYYANDVIQQLYSQSFYANEPIISLDNNETNYDVADYNLTTVWSDPVKLGQSATLSSNGNYVAYMDHREIGGNTTVDRLIVRDIKTGIESSYTFGQQGRNYYDPLSLRLYGNSLLSD